MRGARLIIYLSKRKEERFFSLPSVREVNLARLSFINERFDLHGGCVRLNLTLIQKILGAKEGEKCEVYQFFRSHVFFFNKTRRMVFFLRRAFEKTSEWGS